MSAETHTQHSVERAVRVANRRFQVRSVSIRRVACNSPRSAIRESRTYTGEWPTDSKPCFRTSQLAGSRIIPFFSIFYTFLYLLHLTTPYTRVSVMARNFRHPRRSERGDLLSALRCHRSGKVSTSRQEVIFLSKRRVARARVEDGSSTVTCSHFLGPSVVCAVHRMSRRGDRYRRGYYNRGDYNSARFARAIPWARRSRTRRSSATRRRHRIARCRRTTRPVRCR